jgi:SpoVK/Ycf46/Vps4 family AAA+-type ATPase
MTTNNRDQLDDALIRAGRVDVDEEFTALDQDQAARLSKWMWPEQESDLFSQNFVGKSPAKLIKKIRKRQQKEEI